MTKRRRNRKWKNVNWGEEIRTRSGFQLEAVREGLLTKRGISQKQKTRFIEWCAEAYPWLCREIDAVVMRIRDQVPKWHPLQVLKQGHFAVVADLIGKTSEIDHGVEEAVNLWMVEYIQSVIASTPPDNPTPSCLDQKEYKPLVAEVSRLFHLTFDVFPIIHSGYLKATMPRYDENYDALHKFAFWEWVGVRGKCYGIHELPQLRALLQPHDAVFQDLFDISIEEFISGLEGIKSSLLNGPGILFKELDGFRQTTLDAMEDKLDGATPFPELMAQVIRDQGWEDWEQSLLGRFSGFDLYDLQKITQIPPKLLRCLSWEPDEESDFFSPGEYSGWPLRVLPIKLRPFLCLQGRFYCFELYNLMDNIYRVIESIIIGHKPSYRETWNQLQNKQSENLAVDCFRKLLPNATIYNPAYYRAPAGPNDKLHLMETDGIVLFDDHLIVLEVRAGALSRRSPVTHFDSYALGAKGLIEKPASQAERFLERLVTNGEVQLRSKGGKPFRTIRSEDYRVMTRCCITVDNLSSLSARAEKLGTLGVVLPAPVWPVSLDDLRVYADYFDSPVMFAHFLEERERAARSVVVDVHDELTHLGLYLELGSYAEHTQTLAGRYNTGSPIWVGDREKLDRYFSALEVTPQKAEKPMKRNVTAHIKEILELLDAQNKPGRCRCGAYLLQLDERTSAHFNEQIDCLLAKEPGTDRSTHTFSIETGDKAEVVLRLTLEGKQLTGVDFDLPAQECRPTGGAKQTG